MTCAEELGDFSSDGGSESSDEIFSDDLVHSCWHPCARLSATTGGFSASSEGQKLALEQMRELQQTFANLTLMLHQWTNQAKSPQTRFPQLQRLLSVHFGTSESQSTNQCRAHNKYRSYRRPLGQSQSQPPRSINEVASMRETESRYERKLQRAVESYRSIDMFKAICCYQKVSRCFIK